MKPSDIPNLQKEFHLTKHGDLKPINLSYGSSKKFWQQCKNNNKHEWNTRISGRIFRKNGCPICYKKKEPFD